MPKLHLKILNKNQARLFPQLHLLKKQKFYLAGGTALALHLGHRTSLDFDFYKQTHFDSLKFSQKIEETFTRDAKITLREKDTVFCKILEVDFSFFWYKYPLVKKLVVTRGPLLASTEDIAAMKLISITQRPVKRDYIDIFYLLKMFSLEKMFSLVKKKYPHFNQYFSLRALTYFEDVESKEDKRKIKIFDKNFSWEKAKKEIFEAVRKYQLGMIKKN